VTSPVPVVLLWPSVAVLGFVVLAVVVIALGTSSTARYEFERNRVQEQRRKAAVPVLTEQGDAEQLGAGQLGAGQLGAGQVAVSGANRATPAASGGAAAQEVFPEAAAAVGLAAHPAGSRLAERGAVPQWWLVDGADDGVLAGPFPDRIAADWAALSAGSGSVARSVFGVRRTGGGVIRQQSPQEQAWLSDLGDQLDRLGEDWDERLSDDDALVTLVVEIAAALVEAGLTVHDCAGSGSSGGVCLTPEPGSGGVLVSWRQHDRMSRDQVRGAAVDATVQQTMNVAVADCLSVMGFEVVPFAAGCSLVTAADWW
jgi:hypothetical protein